MNLYSVDYLPSQNYQTLGLVKGSMVQSKHIGRDIMAGLKVIVCGEIKGYTEMLNDARHIATTRMIEEARNLGANAIIGVRYATSSVMSNTSEVLVYGTAIKIH